MKIRHRKRPIVARILHKKRWLFTGEIGHLEGFRFYTSPLLP